MNEPTTLQALMREAAGVEARWDEVDEASVRPDVDNRDELFAEVYDCHRKLDAIDREAASHQAYSFAGALFQVEVAKRALDIIKSCALSPAETTRQVERVAGVLMSLKSFIDCVRTESNAPLNSDSAELTLLAEKVKAAIAGSTTWADLQSALAAHDLELEPAGSGLYVLTKSTGARVAKASAVGLRYAVVMRKFGAAFPSHPASWLTDQVLGSEKRAQRAGT